MRLFNPEILDEYDVLNQTYSDESLFIYIETRDAARETNGEN